MQSAVHRTGRYAQGIGYVEKRNSAAYRHRFWFKRSKSLQSPRRIVAKNHDQRYYVEPLGLDIKAVPADSVL